jgi:hypothetical protein
MNRSSDFRTSHLGGARRFPSATATLRRAVKFHARASFANGCTDTRTFTRWSRRLRIVISRSTVKRSSWALRIREKSAVAMLSAST